MSDADEIDVAVAALQAGDVIGLPTETVYGLAGDAANPAAVARIFSVKGRPAINPLIAHVPSLEAAEGFGVFNAAARALAEAFWPGPLTLVLPYRGEGVCEAARAGLETLALRVPSHPVAQDVLQAFGGPLAAPSANQSGRLSPTRADDVRAELGAVVRIVLDAGPSAIGLESTIVDCTDAVPRLLRPGGLTAERLKAVAGPIVSAGSDGPVRAPGALASHYAPRAHVRLDIDSPEPGEAYLAFGDGPNENAMTINLSPSGDLSEAAHTLFAALRRLDATGAATIAVAPIPRHGLGLAINDRLARAAAERGGT